MAMDSEEAHLKLLAVLKHVFEKEGMDGAPFFDIEKIFYYTRDRLDDDNDLVEELNYYWYVDGFMSDEVKTAVDWGVHQGILQASPTRATQSGTWYTFKDTTQFERLEKDQTLQEAMTAAEEAVLYDYDVYNDYKSKVKQVYDGTPYPFQEYYKIKVLLELEKFKEDTFDSLDPEELSQRISVAESYLPLDDEFAEFNTIFGRFATAANRYLTNVPADSKPLVDSFHSLAEEMWELFCRQLRLLEHEEPYDEKQEKWKSTYEEKKRMVLPQLREFEDMMDETITSEGSSTRVPEESAWGQIAAQYLSDEEQND